MIWSCTKKTVKRTMQKGDRIEVYGDVRGRRRPKLTWESIVKNDMILLNLIEHISLNRVGMKKKDSYSRL